ncbi:Uncharacterised protein [Nocardia otitidiscaviarum]|uniref:Uncharacterized protein n=1 Tax=Nocardia otitidiscaviarum TaxID=1823 RepID=A0A379JLZ6_9NOCA|nr:hypothetical protein [Nocardia otitidiscaviarum]SUD49535.1 Uncharacterised protein [Nocardia otitidiscaviarum]
MSTTAATVHPSAYALTALTAAVRAGHTALTGDAPEFRDAARREALTEAAHEAAAAVVRLATELGASDDQAFACLDQAVLPR